jgi:hypothetical protein
MVSTGGSGGNTDGPGTAEDASDFATVFVVVVMTREMGMGTPIGKDLTAGHSN